jgi:hypothetical protein
MLPPTNKTRNVLAFLSLTLVIPVFASNPELEFVPNQGQWHPSVRFEAGLDNAFGLNIGTPSLL